MGVLQVKVDLLRIDDFSFDSKFYTRCHVEPEKERICSLRIDGGSGANFASMLLVERLNLETSMHPTPYKLQLSKEYEEIQVTEQVLISFSIGKYQDQVLCDVVPMETCHILLGQPSCFDRKANCDEIKNRCTLVQRQRRVNIKLLNSLQVYEDLMQLRQIFAKHRECEKQREKQKCESEIELVTESKGEDENEIRDKSENTMESKEGKEIECETLENDICFSTNELSFPSKIDSPMQEFKDLCPQEISNDSLPLKDLQPLSAEKEVVIEQDNRVHLSKKFSQQ